MRRLGRFHGSASALALLLCLAACSRSADQPGGITADEASQLNDAAAALDTNSVDANAAAPDTNGSDDNQ